MIPTKTFPIEIGTYNTLCEVNAELVAALEDITKQARLAMQYCNNYDGQLIQAIANADAALAKANGAA